MNWHLAYCDFLLQIDLILQYVFAMRKYLKTHWGKNHCTNEHFCNNAELLKMGGLPNPIESAFATVRLRSKRAKNCGPRETTLAMVYKLLETTQKKCRRIQGFNMLSLVLNNVVFKDGEDSEEDKNQSTANAA